MLMMTETFSDEPLDLITPYGAADNARRHRQPKTRCGTRVRAYKDREHRIPKATSILVDAVEVRFGMKALRRSERSGDRVQEDDGRCDEVRRSAACALSHDDARVRRVQNVSPYAPETHASADGVFCLADRCAS